MYIKHEYGDNFYQRYKTLSEYKILCLNWSQKIFARFINSFSDILLPCSKRDLAKNDTVSQLHKILSGILQKSVKTLLNVPFRRIHWGMEPIKKLILVRSNIFLTSMFSSLSNVLLCHVSVEYVDTEYSLWLTWFLMPVIVTFLLPAVIIVLIYISAIIFHLYRLYR